MRATISHQISQINPKAEETRTPKTTSANFPDLGWSWRNRLASMVILGVIAIRLLGPAETPLQGVQSPPPVVQTADWIDDLLEILKNLGGGGSTNP